MKQYSTVKDSSKSVFHDAQLRIPTQDEELTEKLSFSRAYSIALAPQLIYTDSRILQTLVTSRVYRQLDFLAMGSWWIYSKDGSQENTPGGRLIRVPTSREDVAFADSAIDLRSKRLVMKVLRFVMEYEDQTAVWEIFKNKPFADFLVQNFKLPPLLVDLFVGLSLSSGTAAETFTAVALPRVARHLRSIGRLGPGFSSVIPKWGGLSEISQVACRAGAVGGAVYMLGSGIMDLQSSGSGSTLKLANEVTLQAKVVVGSHGDMYLSGEQPSSQFSTESLSHLVTVVASSLSSLFPSIADGAPNPAGSVVIFPEASIDDTKSPIHLIIHSSDTGECPKGQSESFSFRIINLLYDELLLKLIYIL